MFTVPRHRNQCRPASAFAELARPSRLSGCALFVDSLNGPLAETLNVKSSRCFGATTTATLPTFSAAVASKLTEKPGALGLPIVGNVVRF